MPITVLENILYSSVVSYIYMLKGKYCWVKKKKKKKMDFLALTPGKHFCLVLTVVSGVSGNHWLTTYRYLNSSEYF